MSRWPVAGPSEYWLLASSPASKVKIQQCTHSTANTHKMARPTQDNHKHNTYESRFSWDVRKRVGFYFIRDGNTGDRKEGGNNISASIEYGGISLLAEWLCICEKECFRTGNCCSYSVTPTFRFINTNLKYLKAQKFWMKFCRLSFSQRAGIA